MTLSGFLAELALPLNSPDCTFPSSCWKSAGLAVSRLARAGSCSVGGSSSSTASTCCLILLLGPIHLHKSSPNNPGHLASQPVSLCWGRSMLACPLQRYEASNPEYLASCIMPSCCCLCNCTHGPSQAEGQPASQSVSQSAGDSASPSVRPSVSQWGIRPVRQSVSQLVRQRGSQPVAADS
jgi:hypothetical protein